MNYNNQLNLAGDEKEWKELSEADSGIKFPKFY